MRYEYFTQSTQKTENDVYNTANIVCNLMCISPCHMSTINL